MQTVKVIPRDEGTAPSIPSNPSERATTPPTEALGQPTGELAVIPGSAAYREWLALLRQGDITYAEFIDWTQIESRLDRRARLRVLMRRLLAGLIGSWPHTK